MSRGARSSGSEVSLHRHPVSGGGTAGVAPREDVRLRKVPQVDLGNQAEQTGRAAPPAPGGSATVKANGNSTEE